MKPMMEIKVRLIALPKLFIVACHLDTFGVDRLTKVTKYCKIFVFIIALNI